MSEKTPQAREEWFARPGGVQSANREDVEFAVRQAENYKD